MQKVSCPSCGAEVSFRSAASVMAVCEYCHSTLLKDAESVKDIGKMSDLLEDYSPIQINTSGVFQGRPFGVVGRIQLRYEAGLWNEWYVLFADSTDGWLSDASGQYVFTLPEPDAPQAPPFEQLSAGYLYPWKAEPFVAADVRTAQCIAGQGELPFRVGQGWQAKVADFRSGNRFLTLDYSDVGLGSDRPQVFLGRSVSLEDLRCQLLRSDDDIAGASGRFKGKTTALDCPSCGSAIKYQAGMAMHIVCPSCHAEVDCSADKALVLQKHEEIARVATTLSLGDTGTIDTIQYSVIGLMKCRDPDPEEPSEWIEYLLFNAREGFLWLVESSEGWDRVEVLNEWPKSLSSDTLSFREQQYKKLYEYDAIVLYAAGAFNWRISIGDKTHLADYAKGDQKLSAETTAQEITWSASKKVSAQQVASWFGKAPAAVQSQSGAGKPSVLSTRAAIIYSILVAVLNVPISFASGRRGLVVILVALLLIWAPVAISRYFSNAS
jgi:hypothetical protein